jgi:hypothetical protein
MKDRRAFLGAVVSAALFAAAPTAVRGQTAVPSASPPPPDDAFAAARAMKRFDPSLTDEEILKIARDVADARSAARNLNPKKNPLRNAEEPVTRFVVRDLR